MRNYFDELRRCETINELVWIYTDYIENTTGGNFFAVWKVYQARRTELEELGKRYTRAKKPSWMK